MEISLNENINMDKYIKNLNEMYDSGKVNKYFGFEKYECFNNLSERDKNILVDSITEGALHDLRYGYDLNEDFSNTIFAENFDSLSMNEQEKRMQSYIDKVLGDSRNG